MKRGRPTKRQEVHNLILGVLKADLPQSINAICKEINNRTGKRISWNTVKKYIEQLVEFDKVKSLPMPHSKKDKEYGLTVYVLKE